MDGNQQQSREMMYTGRGSRSRLRILVVLTLVASSALAALNPPAAHASTTYTWTNQGGDGQWSNSKNWDPQGVPGDGDSVTIASTSSDPGPSVVGAPTGTTLQNLTLGPSTPGNSSSLSGGSLSVAGTFIWNGAGILATDIDVLPRATATISGGQDQIGVPGQILSGSNNSSGSATGTITVEGTASISDYLVTGYQARTFIVNKGTLTLNPGATIFAEVCCVNPNQLVNQGTLILPSPTSGTGTVTLNAEAFIDQGPVQIDPSTTLDLLGPPPPSVRE